VTTEQLTPQEAYTWATKIMPNCRNDELEQIIMTDPEYASYYAEDVIKERWIEAEPIIATQAWASFYYAATVIKGRFELGEPILRESPYWERYKRYSLTLGIKP
jgi:hypothetical protein